MIKHVKVAREYIKFYDNTNNMVRNVGSVQVIEFTVVIIFIINSPYRPLYCAKSEIITLYL